ncbi:MAG: formate dehydrogenase subunit alpha [Candidatus Thioglobus sp.]|nr:formate dehydrogenase subunit alpha [Candidatus Thioglobus sp.]
MSDNPQGVFIDDVEFPFDDSTSILEFSNKSLGEKIIPTLCDDDNLKPYGACRVCSVEVQHTEDGPKRTVASCHTPINPGMRIYTNSDSVKTLRRNIVELVLSDHPPDCLTCEVNGNCELQDVAASVGVRRIRYAKGKNHCDREKDLSHAYMRMDLSKCINCSRCVRACDEVQGQFTLTMTGRGFESRITTDNDMLFGDSSCVSCGACAQTCPTSAISDVFQSKSVEADKTVRTTCSYCGVGCNLEVAVKNDEVLSIRAPQDAVNKGHTCLKGRYAFKFYNHEDRLTSPLIRKNGELTPCSWDEALDFIKDKFESIKEDHGSDSIAGISSARCTNEENYMFQKMIRQLVGTNNIDCCARVCHSPTAWGMQQSFGTGAGTNSALDIPLADCMIIIGANPTAAHPVTGAKIKQQAISGATLIVIDPVRTELARMADHHLQLKPGTNVAVLNMIQYFIVEAGLVDYEFIKDRCEGGEEFIEKIKDLDVDAMAKISGLDKEDVKAVALAYASAENAMEFHGLGVTEHSQGSQTVMLISNIAMMTGNLGRPGVGVNPLRGQNNVQGAADMGCQPHHGPGYLWMDQKEVQDFYEDKLGLPMPTTPGRKIPEMFDGAIDGSLKALWIFAEDVVQTDPNTHHVVKAMQGLDLLVVQEIFMSETAKMADVVLPGTTFLEKSGTFTNTERRVQQVNAAVKPLKGTKTDGQIIVEMMRKLGFDQPDFDASEVLKEVASVVSFFEGITWEGLGANPMGLQWPVNKKGEDTQILHIGEFKRGKGKFHYYDWRESEELVKHKNEYPFILTTSRELQHYNCATMTRRTSNVEILPKDVIMINPKDAKAKQLLTGDRATLKSDRGEITLDVEVTDRVKRGVVRTTFHFPEVLINEVTSAVTDEETKCPEYKIVAVDVLKAS